MQALLNIIARIQKDEPIRIIQQQPLDLIIDIVLKQLQLLLLRYHFLLAILVMIVPEVKH